MKEKIKKNIKLPVWADTPVRPNRGITLVALVITIIIMLILATVTIGAINGGLFNYAGKAVSEAELDSIIEELKTKGIMKGKNNLNGTLSEVLENNYSKYDSTFKVVNGELVYTGEDGKIVGYLLELGQSESSIEHKSAICSFRGHDFLPANYLNPKICKRCGTTEGEVLVATAPHPDQNNSTDIGIGTDGQLVNLDKWTYMKISGTWQLKGYKGAYSDPEGEIEGKVPQVINNIKVTSMNWTFENATNLKTAPVLPATVTSVSGTFSKCSNLENFTEGFTLANLNSIAHLFDMCVKIKKLPDTAVLSNGLTGCPNMFRGCSGLLSLPANFTIPYGCTNIKGMFQGCSSLEALPENFSIPTTVKEMGSILNGCIKLKSLPQGFIVPNGVTSLYASFYHCEDLTTIPENYTIPASVSNMGLVFSYCKKLEGTIILLNNPTTYNRFFDNVATTGSGLTVKYTDACTNIDEIKATATSGTKVTFIKLPSTTE